MVDAEQVEDLAHLAHALAPPAQILLLEHIPTVQGHPPVLAPAHGEEVALKGVFRRRAAAPLTVKDLRLAEVVGAVQAHAKGDVSHERNPEAFCMCAHRGPLAPCDPLHVHDFALPELPVLAHLGGLLGQPRLRRKAGAALLGPRVPPFRSVLGHQHPEERKPRQPPFLFRHPRLEGPGAGRFALPLQLQEPLERTVQNRPLQGLHDFVKDRPLGGAPHVEVRPFLLEDLRRQVGQGLRCQLDGQGIQRHGGNGVVGGVVVTGFVDGQQLDHPQVVGGRPVDQLPERPDITHPQIVRAPEREQRRQNP